MGEGGYKIIIYSSGISVIWAALGGEHFNLSFFILLSTYLGFDIAEEQPGNS